MNEMHALISWFISVIFYLLFCYFRKNDGTWLTVVSFILSIWFAVLTLGFLLRGV